MAWLMAQSKTELRVHLSLVGVNVNSRPFFISSVSSAFNGSDVFYVVELRACKNQIVIHGSSSIFSLDLWYI